MLAPIDYSRVETALARPSGWAELAIVALCFFIGWAVGRRVNIRTDERPELVRVGLGGVNRLVLPLVTLSLLVVAHAAFRRFAPPFFLSIALPLVVALAAIRLIVYALRGVFGGAPWMKTSERAIASTVWFIVLLYFTGVLPLVADELDALRIPIGKVRVSVFDILKGIAMVIVTIAVTLWASGLIETRLMRVQTLDANVRAILGKTVRAALVAIALLISLQTVGIDLTVLSVFGGAIGIGIGLGLQKLASNYIAGFTILLDRSIRVGDLVTVADRHGVVAEVTSRYVVVRGGDGVESIVPNETLITTTVLNHSYSTPDVRLTLDVHVSYDSDVELALRLLEEIARREPRVLGEPTPPQAFLCRLGESGIELELGMWIRDPDKGQLNLKSSINLAILRSFRENGIGIPFPQRDIRIISHSYPTGDVVGPKKREKDTHS